MKIEFIQKEPPQAWDRSMSGRLEGSELIIRNLRKVSSDEWSPLKKAAESALNVQNNSIQVRIIILYKFLDRSSSLIFRLEVGVWPGARVWRLRSGVMIHKQSGFPKTKGYSVLVMTKLRGASRGNLFITQAFVDDKVYLSIEYETMIGMEYFVLRVVPRLCH